MISDKRGRGIHVASMVDISFHFHLLLSSHPLPLHGLILPPDGARAVSLAYPSTLIHVMTPDRSVNDRPIFTRTVCISVIVV